MSDDYEDNGYEDGEVTSYDLARHHVQYFLAYGRDPVPVITAMAAFIKDNKLESGLSNLTVRTIVCDDRLTTEGELQYYRAEGAVSQAIASFAGAANADLMAKGPDDDVEPDCTDCVNAMFSQSGEVRCKVLVDEIVYDTQWAKQCGMFEAVPDHPMVER